MKEDIGSIQIILNICLFWLQQLLTVSKFLHFFISISSLISVLVSIASSAVGIKICAITAELKSISHYQEKEA